MRNIFTPALLPIHGILPACTSAAPIASKACLRGAGFAGLVIELRWVIELRVDAAISLSPMVCCDHRFLMIASYWRASLPNHLHQDARHNHCNVRYPAASITARRTPRRSAPPDARLAA